VKRTAFCTASLRSLRENPKTLGLSPEEPALSLSNGDV
jgi:hypothetical protein